MKLINVFVDDATGRNITCLSLARDTAVPMMDFLWDEGFQRLNHDGWFTLAEEAAQRETATLVRLALDN